MPFVKEIASALEKQYPLRLAEGWDRVGLVCGDPDAGVSKAMIAVDVTEETAAEAVHLGVQLLIAHHPLLLHGVHSVATTTSKGRIIHQLITNGVALYAAHTNADSARGGVSEALAQKLGLEELVPLAPTDAAFDRLVVLVPQEHRDAIIDAVDRVAGAVLGDYTRAAFWTDGTGTFVPGDTANPAIGQVGEASFVSESRVEITIPRHKREAVVDAMLAVHPYEAPAYDVIPLAVDDREQGLGRVGVLPQEMTLREFAERVASVLPSTAAGVRAAGDPEKRIRRVAVCGGAGDSLLSRVKAADVDAYVTADLRHHPATESLADGGPALVDASHWASEWPWCENAADLLRQEWPSALDVHVSHVVTDPWTIHYGS